MNKNKILAIVAMAITTMVGFSSCEEDEEEVVWVSEKMGTSYIKRDGYYSDTYNLKELDGKTIIEDTIICISSKGQKSYRYSEDMDMTTRIDVKYGVVGGDTLYANGVADYTIKLDKPFAEYFIESVSYGLDVDGNKYYVREPETVHFYYIPKLDFSLSRKFGKGESATVIKWDIRAYLNNKKELTIPTETLKHFAVTVEISSDEAPCNPEPIELTGDVDSIYVTKDIDNGIYLTRNTVYDADNSLKYLYEEAYKYKFKVNVTVNVGDTVVALTDSITSIIVDGDLYAIDDELNIYNTIKIGNDVWTIDNYRGTKVKYYTSESDEYNNKAYYFYQIYDGWSEDNYNKINKHIINGYHVATESDWSSLEKYLGIEYKKKDYLSSYDDEVFDGEDVTKYADYFATNVPWHVFDPEDGYADYEMIQKYPFSFNVDYAGYRDSRYGELAVYSCASGYGHTRCVSKKYSSICKLSSTMAHVRLVKDK